MYKSTAIWMTRSFAGDGPVAEAASRTTRRRDACEDADPAAGVASAIAVVTSRDDMAANGPAQLGAAEDGLL
jgi:hypothetical protein